MTPSRTSDRPKASLASSRRTVPLTLDPAIGFPHDWTSRPPFVDFADDLLEQVFDGDEASGSAVLVHHDGHLRAIAAHRGQHFVELRWTRNIRQGSRVSGRDRLVRNEMPEDFFDVQAADDVVQVAAVDRIARVSVRAHDRSKLVGFSADRDSREQNARHHHLTGGSIAKREQVPQDLTGLPAKEPAFLALADDELEFLCGVITLDLDLAALDASQAQQPVAHTVERDDQRQIRSPTGTPLFKNQGACVSFYAKSGATPIGR